MMTLIRTRNKNQKLTIPKHQRTGETVTSHRLLTEWERNKTTDFKWKSVLWNLLSML